MSQENAATRLTLPATPGDFDAHAWASYEPFYAELQSRPIDASTVREWLADWSHLLKLAHETFAWTSIQHSLDTRDEGMRARYLDFVRHVQPHLTHANQALNERFLALGLDDEDLQLMIRDIQSAADLFVGANVPLQAQERTLATEYDKITGGMKADWDGEELNLMGLDRFLTDRDRATRERAWRTSMNLWLENRQPLNDLFVELLKLRRRMAEQAELSDYRAYAFRARRRFAYTPADCLTFHDAIEATVVPLAQRLLEEKRAMLGVASLRPWDTAVDPGTEPPLQPYATETELIEKGVRVFSRVGERFGRYFAALAEDELLDLQTRTGKRLGAYCSTLPVRKRPFIFMNGSGIHRNVQTLFHESGHAFHAFEVMKNQELVWHARPPMEFNEVASMAMELLASPYLTHQHGGFYTPQEAARAQIEHLHKIILFMPYMSVVDLFQHWLYTHPDEAEDPANLDAKWGELWTRFMRGVDWDGVEAERVTGWHRKLHIFRAPFYYIEYGMAQVGALQIWRNSLSDYEQAVADYHHALTLGSTVSLPALYEAAGAEFRFDTDMLSGLMALVETRLDELKRQSA